MNGDELIGKEIVSVRRGVDEQGYPYFGHIELDNGVHLFAGKNDADEPVLMYTPKNSFDEDEIR